MFCSYMGRRASRRPTHGILVHEGRSPRIAPLWAEGKPDTRVRSAGSECLANRGRRFRTDETSPCLSLVRSVFYFVYMDWRLLLSPSHMRAGVFRPTTICRGQYRHLLVYRRGSALD